MMAGLNPRGSNHFLAEGKLHGLRAFHRALRQLMFVFHLVYPGNLGIFCR